MSNYSIIESKKSQYNSLKFENDIIKEELETEERWMRRIANEALDSEEGNLLVIFKSLWYLSTKEPNCYDIINNSEVIDIISSSSQLFLVYLVIYANQKKRVIFYLQNIQKYLYK